MDDLRARVRGLLTDPVTRLVHVGCRAATIDGKAVDFTFALDFEDERLPFVQPGSRVLYSTNQAVGVWGYAEVKGFEGQKIPVDEITKSKAGASYRQALNMDNGAPPLDLRRRVQLEADAMNFMVTFIHDEFGWCVETHVPGRGKTKHYKEPGTTWSELLTAAGLAGTL